MCVHVTKKRVRQQLQLMNGSTYKTIILIKLASSAVFASVAFIWNLRKSRIQTGDKCEKAPDRLWYPCCSQKSRGWYETEAKIWSNPVRLLLFFHPQARARVARVRSSNRCASFTELATPMRTSAASPNSFTRTSSPPCSPWFVPRRTSRSRSNTKRTRWLLHTKQSPAVTAL